MKIRKLMSAMTAAACVLSFAAGTGTPAVLSVSAADAPAASAVTTAVTTDATYLTGSGHFHFNSTTTTPTTDSTTFFSSGTKTNISVPGTVVTTSGPKEPAGTVMTQTTADLRNVPLQGKFNIKITIEDILGLALPALDCELIRLDTDEVVASWNTGTEPNKVVENLDYSFKRLDVTLKGDIIYALRIKNMPDHMVFYDTKMPNPIRIAGISILEFANGTNIYGNVKLCDPNYTEPAHTEVTTGIPTAADMTATTNNTTYTTATSTVMTHITTLPTTDATYTHDTTYTHSTENRTGDPLIIYGNGNMQLGDLYYFDVSGVTPESLLTYKFDKDIVEIVSQDENHLLLKGIKPGKTLMTAKIANGRETSMMINISEETAPAVTNVTADILLPKENTKVSTTVKTWCVSNDTQPVFDEQGHYRGTNALWSVKLETATEPKIGMQLSEDGKTVKSLDLTEIYVQMTEQRRFNIYGHNVSYQLKVLDYGYTQETDNTAQFYVKLGTDYKDGQYEGMEIQPLTLKFKLPDLTSEPAVTTYAGTDIILPARNTNVTSTCVSENTQPVWDEEGHYRGTNAPQKAYLETVTEPALTVKTNADGSVQLPVDLSGIKIKLVEERRFNINEYDVTGMLKVLDSGIEQGTGPEQTFFVTLGTDYKNGKIGSIEIKPVTIRVKVSESAAVATTATNEKGQLVDADGNVIIINGTSAVASGMTFDSIDRGNVNCKEGTDVSDAVLLARFVAEDTDANITAEGKKNADVNGDGKLTSDDVIVILRIIAKLV